MITDSFAFLFSSACPQDFITFLPRFTHPGIDCINLVYIWVSCITYILNKSKERILNCSYLHILILILGCDIAALGLEGGNCWIFPRCLYAGPSQATRAIHCNTLDDFFFLFFLIRYQKWCKLYLYLLIKHFQVLLSLFAFI